MFPQSTILGPLFWIVMGIIYAFIIYSARLWAKDLRLAMNWWKWTLVAFWFVFLNITIAGGFTLIGENEKHAGLYFIGFFGFICIISGIALWRLLLAKREKS